jgi:hypothetical protein
MLLNTAASAWATRNLCCRLPMFRAVIEPQASSTAQDSEAVASMHVLVHPEVHAPCLLMAHAVLVWQSAI